MSTGYSVGATEFLRIIGALLAGALLGLVSGHLWIALALALGLLLAWHLFQAGRLLHWMRDKSHQEPQFPPGFWREIARLVRDLQERSRRRKQKVSRFFKQFRGAAASIPDALVILGRSGTIDWCNHAAEELLGLRWPEDRDALFDQRLPHPEVARYLSDGNYTSPLELTSPTNNALLLAMHVTYFGKKRYQRLLVVRDITRTHNIDRIRRDFIANISHELRTPLTVIYGYLEAMQEEQEECVQWQRPLELMEQQATRMQNVVNDLLALSRLELNPAQRPNTPVNIPRILREITEDARALARSDAPILSHIDESLWMRGADDELRSAFGNLVYNAIRHTPPGTQITISWGRRYNGLVFSVTDEGEGIEPHHIPRLTERFYRVDTARSRSTGGTGLGLAIVKQIVQRYDGRLTIQSAPNKGSTFRCIFPKALTVYNSDLETTTAAPE